MDTIICFQQARGSECEPVGQLIGMAEWRSEPGRSLLESARDRWAEVVRGRVPVACAADGEG